MDRIRFRDLQRFRREILEEGCPLGVSVEGEVKFVLLKREQYRKLVRDYRLDSHRKEGLDESDATFTDR